MERENGANEQNVDIPEYEKNCCFLGKMGSPLFAWPWDNLGIFKASYFLPPLLIYTSNLMGFFLFIVLLTYYYGV